MVETENKPRISVGITGGIGSGKSVVSRILRLQGFPVYDCDSEAKRLMHSNSLREKLKELLGTMAYDESGMLNRDYVSQLIFSDAALREAMNAMVHREVLLDYLSFLAQSDIEPCFCESAILATSHMDSFCNKIMVVVAPDETRLSRAMARDNADAGKIMARMQTQAGELRMLPAEKTLTIENNGDDLLLPQMRSLIKAIEREYDLPPSICEEVAEYIFEI